MTTHDDEAIRAGLNEPSKEAKQAANQLLQPLGLLHPERIVQEAIDAATAKVQRIADDSIVENVRLMNETAKLREKNGDYEKQITAADMLITTLREENAELALMPEQVALAFEQGGRFGYTDEKDPRYRINKAADELANLRTDFAVIDDDNNRLRADNSKLREENAAVMNEVERLRGQVAILKVQKALSPEGPVQPETK